MDAPIILLDKVVLSDNYFVSQGFTYDVPNLIEFCKEQKFPIFDIPLAALNLSLDIHSINSVNSFAYHCKRVQDCSLEYPIILDVNGSIADGVHRVVKAILEGHTTIKGIRMMSMPKISGTVIKE